jgi:hypothetical protein
MGTFIMLVIAAVIIKLALVDINYQPTERDRDQLSDAYSDYARQCIRDGKSPRGIFDD